MCGRFSLRLNHNEIRELEGYDADVAGWDDEDAFVPRYNIAPRTQVPVIRHPNSSADNAPNNNTLIIQTMKWGLVPHWSKFEDKSLNTINARAENLVGSGGMWASIKGKNRCAVPCQGYYEWLTKGKDKIPHFTKRKDNRILLLAGLYDSVVLEGKTLWTFTIVTTDANKEFSWLHDRQPVFLTNHDALMRWLDTSPQTWTPELTKMVQPYSDASVALECYAVPKEVGKVGTESAQFIEPIAARSDGIKAMFSKQDDNKPKRKHESPPIPDDESKTCEGLDVGKVPKKKPKLEDGDHLTSSKSPKKSNAKRRDNPSSKIPKTKGTLDSFFNAAASK